MTDFIVKTVMSIIVFLLVGGIYLLGKKMIDPREEEQGLKLLMAGGRGDVSKGGGGSVS